MKRHSSNFLFAILLVLLVMLFAGCSSYNTPPDVRSVQECFQNNRDNIQIIVDFMVYTGYADIYIENTDGTMLVDASGTIQNGLIEKQIDDDMVVAAVSQLLENREYVGINKIGNTIEFQQWSGLLDIGCGIAYTVNGTDAPEIQFATKLIPISEDGWFYYIYDYNEWREQRTID